MSIFVNSFKNADDKKEWIDKIIDETETALLYQYKVSNGDMLKSFQAEIANKSCDIDVESAIRMLEKHFIYISVLQVPCQFYDDEHKKYTERLGSILGTIYRLINGGR